MSTTPQSPDYAAITGKQQAAWSTGDFNQLALKIMPVSEALCYAVDPRPNHKVLDVACGSGNAALVAARRHCDVTGVDFAPNLLERARKRAEAEGSHAEFIEGDAQALPFPDAHFDAALSVFGIMFAPQQEKAAQELLRVCKPGARIGLANWIPEGFGGDFFRLIGSFVPPPPGLNPPVRWGTEQGLKELIGPGIASITIEPKELVQHFRSMPQLLEIFFQSFGPMMRAMDTLNPEQRSALRQGTADLFAKYNRAKDGSVELTGRYIQVVAIKK